MLKAIVNELQPFRWTDITDNVAWVISESRWLYKWITEASSSLLRIDFLALANNKTNQFNLAIMICWIAGYCTFLLVDFASLYIILSLFVAIFLNLGERQAGEMSAYSVFNKGFVNLQGTLRGEDLDREIRHQQHINLGNEESSLEDDDNEDYIPHFEDELPVNIPSGFNQDNNGDDNSSFAARLRLRQVPRS